jgi:GT2 family glycosyltransferase
MKEFMHMKICKVEIVTPVHNRKAITLQCLRSIGELCCNNFSYHIIVVDDGSTDGTGEAIAEEFPEVQVIRGDGNLWYTRGTNVGIEAALLHGPDYVLAINDDSTFDPHCVEAMVSCAREHPKSVVGALLCDWDEPMKVFQVAPCWDTWWGGWRHPMHLTREKMPFNPFEVELIVGNCVLYPTEAICEVGLMNEEAFRYGFGDAEYTPRMRKKGWRLLIEPRAIVFCQPNDVYQRLRLLPLRSLIETLFFDQHKSANLIRLLVTRWESAPSRLLGVIAFGIYCVRLILKALHLGGSWPYWPDPSVDRV